MNEIDPSKYAKIINKKRDNKEENKVKKYLISFFSRSLVVVIILVLVAIIYKGNNSLKDKISNYVFKEDISFTKINKLYNKYLGGILPIKKEVSTSEVFNEKLNYSDASIYHDGVKLSVGDGYLVPALEEGMVVFLGDKDDYGKTVIVENLDGIYYWYGNISSTSLKLYDYIEKGSLIGEVSKDLYMVFSKDGKYLNYEEYIN